MSSPVSIRSIPIIIVWHVYVVTRALSMLSRYSATEPAPTGSGKYFLIFINNAWNTTRAFAVLNEFSESLLDTILSFRYTDHYTQQNGCTLYFGYTRGLGQCFSTSLTLWPFSTVPHVVVTPTIQLLCYYFIVIFASVMNHSVSIWYVTPMRE